MALRLGKKKDAADDDWSDAALLGDTETEEGDTVAAAPEDDSVDSADTFVSDTFEPAAPPRKTLSPILLAAGLVFLLTAVGVGAYFAFFNAPAEVETPVVVTPPPRTAEAEPSVPAKTPPTTPAKAVPAGRAGIPPQNSKAPAIQPDGDKAPAVAPQPAMPTPVPVMRDGMAGEPGKGLPPGTTVQIVQPTQPLTPDLMAQLKTLWSQGAAAKHRGDNAGARRAWQQMLQLRPGHPGIQEAIDKLPG